MQVKLFRITGKIHGNEIDSLTHSLHCPELEHQILELAAHQIQGLQQARHALQTLAQQVRLVELP